MLIVGLTGSLGTGKTTVASYFEKCGAKVIDADRLAHKLIQPKGPCFDPIVKVFGTDILKGEFIQRRSLAKIVFSDQVKLKRLMNILHPVVLKSVKKEIRRLVKDRAGAIIVIDVPLLFEAKWEKEVDVTIVVKSTQVKQIERAQKLLRLSRSAILRRIKAQMPLAQKIRQADIIIDNNGLRSQTRKQVIQVWQKLMRMIKK